MQRKRCLYCGSGWLCEGGGRHRSCPSGSLFWCCKCQLHLCNVHFGQHRLLALPAPGVSVRVVDVEQPSHLLLKNVRISCSFVFSWALPLGACARLEVFVSLALVCVVVCELNSSVHPLSVIDLSFSQSLRLELWAGMIWQWKLALLSDNFGWEWQFCPAHWPSSAFQYSLGF